MPESPDTDERIQKFLNFLNQKDCYTFFLKEYAPLIKQAFALRDLSFRDDSIFIPASQIKTLKADKPIRVFDYDSLLQWLIDTPIKKSAIKNISIR